MKKRFAQNLKTSMRSLYPLIALLLTIVFVSPTFPLNAEAMAHTKEASTLSFIVEAAFPPSRTGEETAVSITGKVKTPEGRPIKGAYIVIRDASTNDVVRTTYSSSFGFYRLEQIESGRSYVLSVTHRRYLFAMPAQLMEINEEKNGVDFIGEPSDE